MKKLFLFFAFALVAQTVSAYTWLQYNHTNVSTLDGLTRRLRLTTADDYRHVRGILVNFNASSGDTRDEHLQNYFTEFLRIHQFAFIGSEGFAQPSTNSNESALVAFNNAIAAFASASGKAEINHAPLVFLSMSAGVGPANIVIRTNASRTIAYAAGSGTFGDLPQIAATQIIQIPAYLWAGDNDVTDIAMKMEGFVATNRISSLRASYAVLQGTTHAQSIVNHAAGIGHLHEAISLSYPITQSPLSPPVVFNRIAEADGWLVDSNTIRRAFATVTNWAAYTGDRTKAYWFPNKNMAYVYRAMATHNPPISLSVPADETEVNPGASITVTVNVAGYAGWTSINIFSFSTNLASFTSGTPTVTLNNVQSGLYVFHATATRGGTNVTTKPVMVTVRKTAAPSYPYIWFASTNGGISAVGNIATPADLQTLLNRTTTVLPGDYVHLRNGNYTHVPQGTNCATCDDPGYVFRVTIAGSSSGGYTTIQSHPGELASIDGGNWVHGYATTRRTWQVGSSGSTTLGAWTITKGIRVYSSSTETRTSTETNSNFQAFPRDLFRSGGLHVYAPNVKVINCILHDTSTGLESFGTSSSPNEYYGNISFNNGWRGFNQLHGHGFYLQNTLSASTKTLSTNIAVNNFDNGSNISGSSDSELYHFRVLGNTFINNRLLLGGRSGTPQGDNQIHNNFTFNADLGFLYHLSPNSVDIQVNNNYIAGGIVQGGMWTSAVFTGNTLIHTKSGQLFILLTSPFCNVPTGWTVNSNTYIVPSGSTGAQLFRDEGCTAPPGNPYYTLAGWRTHTGWELNSTVTAPLPTTNYTILQPNAYDTNRAHLLVYNWASSNNVSVGLSTLGWGVNASVRVRNAQNYWGDIRTNTLPGNSILLPMQASAHSVALPHGSTTTSGSISFPQFGAFILERIEAATATPTNTLIIASSNPASGVTISATTDLNGNGNGTTSFSRDYLNTTVVTLVAPAQAGTNNFSKWQRNGVDFLFNQTLVYSVDANVTLTAVYINPPITTWTFTLASTNPTSGVAITVHTNDNSALGNGVTPFNRTYNDGVDVSFTAPTNVSGNFFQQWTKDGVSVTADPFLALSAKSGQQGTYTATYVTPPATVTSNTLAVQILNGPGATINIVPVDNYGNSSGETPLLLTYNSGQAVTLTAPDLSPYGYGFVEWQDENFLTIGALTNITVIIPTNNPIFMARAVYNTNAPLPSASPGKASSRRRGTR